MRRRQNGVSDPDARVLLRVSLSIRFRAITSAGSLPTSRNKRSKFEIMSFQRIKINKAKAPPPENSKKTPDTINRGVLQV